MAVIKIYGGKFQARYTVGLGQYDTKEQAEKAVIAFKVKMTTTGTIRLRRTKGTGSINRNKRRWEVISPEGKSLGIFASRNNAENHLESYLENGGIMNLPKEGTRWLHYGKGPCSVLCIATDDRTHNLLVVVKFDNPFTNAKTYTPFAFISKVTIKELNQDGEKVSVPKKRFTKLEEPPTELSPEKIANQMSMGPGF